MRDSNPPDETTTQVARLVVAEMKRQGVSQAKLAKAIGSNQASIWRRTSGQVPFDVATLAKVASALGVPMSKFMPARAKASA